MPEQPFSPPLIADAETPAFRGRLSARLSASRRGRSGPRSLSASGLKRTAWLRVVVECPRLHGHLSAGSAVSGLAGRMRHHAKGIELQEAVPAGVPAGGGRTVSA